MYYFILDPRLKVLDHRGAYHNSIDASGEGRWKNAGDSRNHGSAKCIQSASRNCGGRNPACGDIVSFFFVRDGCSVMPKGKGQGVYLCKQSGR
jgi:hypothetical protein